MSKVNLSQANKSYIDGLQNTNQTSITCNKTDAKDTFDKIENSEDIAKLEINTYSTTPKSNINFQKVSIALSAVLAISCTIALISGHGNKQKLINELDNSRRLACEKAELGKNLANMEERLNQTGEENKKLNQTVENLKKQVLSFSSKQGENFEQLKEEQVKTYNIILENPKLDYDPMIPPQKKEKSTLVYLNENLFPFVSQKETLSSTVENSFISGLIKKFRTSGNVQIAQIKKPNTAEALEAALLKNTDTSFLSKGQEVSAGMKIDYGKRTNWSNEKISRDIMQNFFDANEHTLDGVGYSITKEANGIYNIRISGNGVYNVQSLLELGSGNKLAESPYNAGGFGEGSRIVVANLLGQEKTDKIRFRSADWQMDFSTKNSSIIRKVEQTDVLDGNYIEFKTKDKDFVETLIQSINFFNNKNNPDFQDLTFESKDFAFKILPEGKKGNLYLTQRFEYGSEGKWNNSLNGLNLIFKRKPDNEKFKKITGHDFSTGRDRVYLSDDDIYDLTRYFAQDLSNEELINSIIKTECHWSGIDKKNAMTSFVKALCQTAYDRHIGIDFSKVKYCEEYPVSGGVFDSVRNMGYIILNEELGLSKVKMPTIKDVVNKSSKHAACNPTENEIKKLKILEEALRTIYNSIQSSYCEKLKQIRKNCPEEFQINNGAAKWNIRQCLMKFFPEEEITQKYRTDYSDNFKEFEKDLNIFIDKKMSSLKSEDGQTMSKLAKIISVLLDQDKDNQIVKQEITQLKNLEIISKGDISRPRFIFDRKKEIGSNTLGEAIIDDGKYLGHWVDKNYLNNGNFFDLLATWLHEISHKSGGDGSMEFTYKLTDLIESLLNGACNSDELRIKLAALEEVFNSIKI